MQRPVRATLLAAFAATVLAACAAEDPVIERPTSTATPSVAIDVYGTDSLRFEPADVAAFSTGSSITLSSGPSARHSIAIDGGDRLLEAPAGGSATQTLRLDPGTYVIYCDVPGHRVGGMEGKLTVVDRGAVQTDPSSR